MIVKEKQKKIKNIKQVNIFLRYIYIIVINFKTLMGLRKRVREKDCKRKRSKILRPHVSSGSLCHKINWREMWNIGFA